MQELSLSDMEYVRVSPRLLLCVEVLEEAATGKEPERDLREVGGKRGEGADEASYGAQ